LGAALLKETRQTAEEEKIAMYCLKLYQRLSGSRGNLDSHWQEIAERVWPSHSRLFGGRRNQFSEGDKRNEFIFDSTASIALNRFASILDSLLTPMNQTWHRLVPSDPNLLKDRETSLWFENLNRKLFKARYAPKTNFISQNQLIYKMLGAYGSGCMFIDELRVRGDKGLRYRNIHLSEIYFKENHQGIVDTAVRYFPMSARQMKQRWGDRCPAKVLEKCKDNPEAEFNVIHCVTPRMDYDPQRADHKGMEFGSYYVSVEGKRLLEEDGYDTFPYAIARYEQVPGEVYGRSPAMDCLPAIKTLNEMKKTILNHGHRSVAPVLLTHDDGIVDTFSFRPGAMNSGGVNADGKPLVHALPVGNIMLGKELMDDERIPINDSNLVSLFQVLRENPRMTATEVMERTKEIAILLAPTVGRQYPEYHAPLIERELDLLEKQRKIDPLPAALVEAKGEYRIDFESPMARTQRAEEAAGFMRVLEMTMNAAAQLQNPALMDHFNFDTIIPDVSDIHGLPARWRNGAQVIADIRKGRSEEQEQQDTIAAAPAAAAMVKAGAAAKKADAA
jgi:hypothetical protein